jgi:hypothetical protein
MRKSNLTLIFIVALTLLLVTIPANHIQAGAVVDGINMGQDVAAQYTDVNNTTDAGWPYTAAATYTLGRIEAKFAAGNGVAITIEFYDGIPSLGGTLLASGTFTPTAPAPAGTQWEGVDLDNTVSVVSGTNYFVGIKNLYSSPTTNNAAAANPQIYFSLGSDDYAFTGSPTQTDDSRPIVRFFSADPPIITSSAPPDGTQGTPL